MRVDGYNQISQIYSTKKTVKKQDIKKTDSKDQVLISFISKVKRWIAKQSERNHNANVVLSCYNRLERKA